MLLNSWKQFGMLFSQKQTLVGSEVKLERYEESFTGLYTYIVLRGSERVQTSSESYGKQASVCPP